MLALTYCSHINLQVLLVIESFPSGHGTINVIHGRSRQTWHAKGWPSYSTLSERSVSSPARDDVWAKGWRSAFARVPMTFLAQDNLELLVSSAQPQLVSFIVADAFQSYREIFGAFGDPQMEYKLSL